MNISTDDNLDYILLAIDFLRADKKNQITFEKLASSIGISPIKLDTILNKWGKIPPTYFIQFVYKTPKENLINVDNNLINTSITNVSFILKESNRNEQVDVINYSYYSSMYGTILVASSQFGLCYLGFSDLKNDAFEQLKKRFPSAIFHLKSDSYQEEAKKLISYKDEKDIHIQLHLVGTPFQLKVWKELLKIPSNTFATYKTLAKTIDNPKAVRAIGTAVGHNPISLIIPCHRVIRSNGEIGEYHWGAALKIAILMKEKFNK